MADPATHSPPFPGETTALLHDDDTTPATVNSRRQLLLRTAVPFLLILTAVEVAATCCQSGMAALVEGSLCRRAFPDVADPYGDARCKGEQIQADLAWIIGMENTVSVIPGLFVSVPYGIVADRYGPNIVMGMVWLGQFLSETGHLLVCMNPQIFDVRWIYASSCMTLIGGGGAGYAAMRFLVGASLVSEKNRTTIFFYMQAYGTAVGFAAGPIAYFVMSRAGPVGIQALGASLIGFMMIPGFALPRKLSNTPAVAADADDETQFSVRARVSAVLRSTASTLRLVFGYNLQLTLLLGGLIFTTLGAYETTFRLQYATKRFSWTWAEASLLTSVTSAANLAALTIILPGLSYLMLRRDLSALSKDLWLARGSSAAQVLGSFLSALAPSGPSFVAAIGLYECGKGFMASVASIIVAVAKRAGIAQQTSMYACVSIMTSIGHILAGPVLASAFRVGLQWGRAWYGLPFLAAGLLQLCTFSILFYVRQK